MRYRRLDAAGDMMFGSGQADFFKDVPDAPAQAVVTRLNMWLGEWFLDTTDGMAWETKVLGKYTGDTRDPAIRERILGTQGVSAILAYSSNLNRDSRAFTGGVTVDTVYGRITFEGPF